MAETLDTAGLLADLSANIDDLELALSAILKSSISKTASKLPLLDKAKLYVLMSYTIESVIFSSLRLSGVNAKDHPVFKELARVRQYFQKIKEVETGPVKRENMSLDKQAASRIIRHALAGNDRIDQERTEAAEREIEAAKAKLADLEASIAQAEHSDSRTGSEARENASSEASHGRKRKNASEMWNEPEQVGKSLRKERHIAGSEGKSSSKRSSEFIVFCLVRLVDTLGRAV